VKILILGLSTRAIAESAIQGARSETFAQRSETFAQRYDVLTLDYFGDRDQKELVQNYSLMRSPLPPKVGGIEGGGFSAEALLTASRQLDFEAVVYVSNLENHPEVAGELAKGHILLGNTPETLREVRNWSTLRSFCQEAGVPSPATLFVGEALPKEGRWLLKPVRSGGGHGISFWSGKSLDAGHLLQEHIEGLDCSAAFVADGRDCVLLGVTEQLIGREELGARGFAWCGNILPLALPLPVLDAVEDVAAKLTRRFGLRGVNGFDFVLAHREGQFTPYLVEVNPRYTASMELMEWAYGLSIFDLHVRSFEEELPSFSLREQLRQAGFYGKGIVYAGRDATMPETAGWRARGRRDVPFSGERIEARHPICTVLAQGKSRNECWHRLLAEANALRQEIERREAI
jgi:predicted ATP-grasp superfamily ATP-dependent carboligase